MRPRSAPVSAPHLRCAAWARATAASTCVAPSIAICASVAPVAGLMTRKLLTAAGRADCAPAAATVRSFRRASTNAVSSARALSLSASCHSESAARNHTPSIMAAIIAARVRASAPGIIWRRSLRRLDNMRF